MDKNERTHFANHEADSVVIELFSESNSVDDARGFLCLSGTGTG